MSDRQWYQDYQAQLAHEQQGKSSQEVEALLESKVEHVFNPATAAPVVHKWVDRGMKLSCEGAGHVHHEAWKKVPMQQ